MPCQLTSPSSFLFPLSLSLLDGVAYIQRVSSPLSWLTHMPIICGSAFIGSPRSVLCNLLGRLHPIRLTIKTNHRL
jgi:hypothetical protein